MFTVMIILLHDLHPAYKAFEDELFLIKLADKLLPIYEIDHLSSRSHYLKLCGVAATVLVSGNHSVARSC
jgi:hypothetical protein